MSIVVRELTHVYMQNTPFEAKALEDVNWSIENGEFWGLIGHTGSGKSTLVQHLNGLLKPTSGEIVVDDIVLHSKGTKLKDIRQRVGLVFQYPEHQLFEETIESDIAFGPKNMGLPPEEVTRRVKEAMDLVGLDYDKLKGGSPFELSGGQMRRVAIAGVLAMEPQVLILDEPTAGLDPRGRDEILQEISELRERGNITVILVSHSMEDIARLVDKIAVMHQGKMVLTGSAREVFMNHERLISMGLGIPQVTELMIKLEQRCKGISPSALTVEEARLEILRALRRESHA